jgi:hypothetical protein
MLYVIVDGSIYRLGDTIGVNGRTGTTETIATGIAVGTLAFVVTGWRAKMVAGTSVAAYLERDAQILPPARSLP